jgi:uncharacterized protein (UPF0333 family)
MELLKMLSETIGLGGLLLLLLLLLLLIGICLYLSMNRIRKEKTIIFAEEEAKNKEKTIIFAEEEEEAKNIVKKLKKLLENSYAEYKSTKNAEIKSVFDARFRLNIAILNYLLKNNYDFNLLKRITAIDVKKISIDEMEKLSAELDKVLKNKNK